MIIIQSFLPSLLSTSSSTLTSSHNILLPLSKQGQRSFRISSTTSRSSSSLVSILVSLFFLILQLPTSHSDAICPSNCNGNGLCNTNLLCECFDGWKGLDCKERKCPEGSVWASKVQGAYPNFTPRDVIAECSGAGICNKDFATCDCADGFAGPLVRN